MPTLLNTLTNAWQWLEGWDRWLFLKINSQWTSPLLDAIYPWYREANAWVPLYLFLILLTLQNFRTRAVPWILFAIVTVTLTDQCSSHLLKPLVERIRPCRDDVFAQQVRLMLNICSGGYSFPSSHATNHFGFAMYVFLTLRPVAIRWRRLFFLWAATIAYGQVYVGVHYPVDILFGSLLGCALGMLTGWFYNTRIGPLERLEVAQAV